MTVENLAWLLFAILANLSLANVYKLPQLISKAKPPQRYSNMMEPKLYSGMKGAVHSEFSHLNFDANFCLCLDGAMPFCSTRAVSTF